MPNVPALHDDLKDRDLVVDSFPINRTTDAIQLFGELRCQVFFALPSNERCIIIHLPISNVNIIAASPLHSYMCVFRWSNLPVYHLHIRIFQWSPIKIVQKIVQEKTRLKIDQPDSSGGATSTGNVARRAFTDESNFIECVPSIIPIKHQPALAKVHAQLAAIFRIFNSSQLVKTLIWENCAKHLSSSVRLFSLGEYHAYPTQLLAHSEELIRYTNSG